MKYNYESQIKALKYLIENEPHDMEKFKRLYNVDVENNNRAAVSLNDILFSEVWSDEEKVQLIKLYNNEYQKYECRALNYNNSERNLLYRVRDELFSLINKCIKKKNIFGIETLLSLGNYNYIAIIKYVIKYIYDPSERYKFCELIVNYLKENGNNKPYIETDKQFNIREIPSLCDYHFEYTDLENDTSWTNVSLMKDICDTNDLKLVKLLLPIIKDINLLFIFVVKSKNIEMAKFFVEAGVDVNFKALEFENNDGIKIFKTPLKIAIDNHDLEMVKYLYENGAIFDENKVDSNDLQNHIIWAKTPIEYTIDLNIVNRSYTVFYGNNKLDTSIYSSEELSKKIIDIVKNLYREEAMLDEFKIDNANLQDYIIFTKTPLEYAINLGFIDHYIINNNMLKPNDNYKKQYEETINIVKYLYENGSTFSDIETDYTALICFASQFKDFNSTKYYFEEALKKGSKLDFPKIINFIHCKPIFKLCEEYSAKLDSLNRDRNIKLMLERLFNHFSFKGYKDLIIEFSNLLPKDMLKSIPAVFDDFDVSLENIQEILNLGYDINTTKGGINILMHYIKHKKADVNMINKLVSLGANINYQNPQNGDNTLSLAIAKLPEIGYCSLHEDKRLCYPPEQDIKKITALVKTIIELSNQEIIMSESVKENICKKIKPGYPQIVYNEILNALSKKSFKVDDNYFAESVTLLDELIEHRIDIWEYLGNLYNNFANKAIGKNQEFPQIELAKSFKYGTEQNKNIFLLMNNHLKRNFITSIEELKEPDKILNEKYYYNSIEDKYEDRTSLKAAQDKLLSEISRYIGNLDYRQIITLIDSCSIIDIKSITRNDLLITAMNAKDEKLCRELLKRGITIICYDKNGHDITNEKYNAELIDIFMSLNEEYNPNKECEDLLSEIGCEDIVLSKKEPIKKELVKKKKH